ncbi:prepilin-type N-terminal cleavage/methylation domain-containing protein [Lysobacter arenosi]|uniref:Prepilin-type N-terminal cleavage/methylation domain-containing protein n=1 Tax=Lysobacter arenosi TaxID=2795387 RepID=A0ABX7RDA2_9GAMM|nr:PilW family protein [Lysobacter arenosi]QSX75990.1 prepilin-type N-terminal cleavage/methylation domain-containing protein [Lysobacter arenosi]
MRSLHRRSVGSREDNGGFSLVELMISLVLGLLVTAAAVSIFLSNQRTFRATESLARIQEDGRVAFELMARDLRQAAGNPCGRNLPVANVLNGASASTAPWWMDWNRGIVGYDNGSLARTADGTDAVEFVSSGSQVATVIEHGKPAAGGPASFRLNTTGHDFGDGDIILVCDYSQVSILQLSRASEGSSTIEYVRGSGSPGNCTTDLALPVLCGASGGGKTYGPGSLVARFDVTRWFVDDNGRGGRSLYRAVMGAGASKPRDEVAEHIQDLQLTYLVAGAGVYVPASAGLDWNNVVAMRIRISLQGAEKAGVDGSHLERAMIHTVTLRNRTS